MNAPSRSARMGVTAGEGRPVGIERLQTGIRGLDELFDGGVPKGRPVLVRGAPGSGKTVLLNEFLYRGISQGGENGVFVTLEERPDDIARNIASFGWDYPGLIEDRKLAFVDVGPRDMPVTEINDSYELTPLIARIESAVERVGAGRVSIDGLPAVFNRLDNKTAIRDMIFLLCERLKQRGVTTFISAETVGEDSTLSRFGVEDFVADCVLELGQQKGQQCLTRSMFIRKMRGGSFRSGEVEFDVTGGGLRVYPKLPVGTIVAGTSFETRLSTGIERLDAFVGGGIPQGHVVLTTGNTGTGKSLMCRQFLQAGTRRGEPAVLVALEEPAEQIRKTALAHGWDAAADERRGLLTILSVGLIDLKADRLLYDVKRAVERTSAGRIAFDSVSSILSATMDKEKVRQFLIQLSGFLKSRGTTCMMSYLAAGNFGADMGQLLGRFSTNDMRLSSITDGVIVMRYVEKERCVRKLMHILKMRGCDHSRDILHYEIGKDGIRIEGTFGGPGT